MFLLQREKHVSRLSGKTQTRNDAQTYSLAHARTPPILGETNGIDRAVAADGANNGAAVE